MPALNEQRQVALTPCPATCALGEIMCAAHWAMVPSENKRVIFDAQRQDRLEGRKKHSPRWVACAKEAIMGVWKVQLDAFLKAAAAGGTVAADAAPSTTAEAPAGPPADADSAAR